jgi:hypothetical protein
MLGGIDNPQPASDHLDQGRFVGTRAQQDDAGGWCVVVAFGQHRDIDEDRGSPGLEGDERRLAICLGHLAMHDGGRHAAGEEGVTNGFGMGNGGAESDGLATGGLVLPVPHDRLVDRGVVHD